MNLSQSRTRTRYVLQQVVAESDIEAPVVEGHLLNRALYESDLGIASQSLAKLYVDGCEPASDRAELVDLDRIATPREQHVHVRQAQAAPRKLLNEESTSRVLSSAAILRNEPSAACRVGHDHSSRRTSARARPCSAAVPAGSARRKGKITATSSPGLGALTAKVAPDGRPEPPVP